MEGVGGRKFFARELPVAKLRQQFRSKWVRAIFRISHHCRRDIRDAGVRFSQGPPLPSGHPGCGSLPIIIYFYYNDERSRIRDGKAIGTILPRSTF